MSGTHASSPTRRYGAQAVNTAFASETNRGTGKYRTQQVSIGTGTADFYVTAPCAGNLVRVEVNSLTTTTGSHKIGLAITNESNSAAAMIGTTLYDDSPVATAGTPATPTLSATAANLAVDQGDNIKIAYTETGTIAGGTVTLFFENV